MVKARGQSRRIDDATATNYGSTKRPRRSLRRFRKLAGPARRCLRATYRAGKDHQLLCRNVIDPRDLRMRCERKGIHRTTNSLPAVIVGRMLMPVADPTL